MSAWAVTEEAVAALINMAEQMDQLAEKIHQETEKLKTVYEENKEGLGHHSDSIQKVIETVEGTEQDASIPVKKLVLKLQRAALIRKKHIDTQRYTQGMGGRSR